MSLFLIFSPVCVLIRLPRILANSVLGRRWNLISSSNESSCNIRVQVRQLLFADCDCGWDTYNSLRLWYDFGRFYTVSFDIVFGYTLANLEEDYLLAKNKVCTGWFSSVSFSSSCEDGLGPYLGTWDHVLSSGEPFHLQWYDDLLALEVLVLIEPVFCTSLGVI